MSIFILKIVISQYTNLNNQMVKGDVNIDNPIIWLNFVLVDDKSIPKSMKWP